MDFIKHLAKIHFKRLALIPIATGAGLIIPDANNDLTIGCFSGFLAFFVTLGILSHDLRNTKVYELHRLNKERSKEMAKLGQEIKRFQAEDK